MLAGNEENLLQSSTCGYFHICPAAANVTGTEISIGASLTESVNLSKLSVLFIGFVLRLALRVGTSSVMRLALGGLAFENRWLLLRCI